MVVRGTVKTSEAQEDFFYEQCHVEVFNAADPQRIYSAPCEKVQRGPDEVKFDFCPIAFDRPIGIDSLRVIGPDGLPIADRMFEGELPIPCHEEVMLKVWYIMEFV